ncbi:PhnH protein [Candidatus Rhodobacter oscarellae]|uniref:PhnH protein n=1 Tax=Candidatus Rhodobacter oscarellae TaxID=1675527 RepID=A0A0J9E7P1_9RHOB|nr:PhnH protein [Candidatus Rhodobacter lobularis]
MSVTLEGGFANPPVDAAQAFRAAMEAMARPGRIYEIGGAVPPAPMSVAAGALILTLCDAGTPVHLAGAWDCEPVRTWITFHTGAPVVGAAKAMFALGDWAALQPLDAYMVGLADYPDRSATLIVESTALAREGATLSGPGIESEHALNLPELAAFQRNAMLFPLGLDFYFTAGTAVAGLPRTTRVS